VENQMIAPISKTPEQIQHEMLETRESLTGKVAALENQVVGSAQTAVDTLSSTIEKVKEFVSAAPEAVSESVKQASHAVGESMKKVFDISGHVDAHPWASIGVSAGLGFLTGLLVFRGRDSGHATSHIVHEVPVPTRSAVYTAPAPEAAAPSSPGIFNGLLEMLGHKVREVAENLVNTATSAVNNTVKESVPKLVDAVAERNMR